MLGIVALMTGLASFIYEICWIRMLSLVLGASTHSFELMLSAFIGGLALGSLCVRRLVDRVTAPRQLLGWDACFLQLYSADVALLTPVLAYDTLDEVCTEVTATFQRTRLSPMTRRILRTGAQLVLRKPGASPTRRLARFGHEGQRSRSLLFVPIRHGTVFTGVLSIQSYTTNQYTPQSLETLQSLADHCGGALEIGRAHV